MNGRVYDPTLGRFMSADPFIQAPTNSQSLNRYSYVLNNPLSMTDPSGFFFKGFFKIAMTIAVSYFTYGAGTGILGLSEFSATMLAGFTGGLAGSGGNLKMGFVGAFTAGAFYGVGSYFEGLKNAGMMCRGTLSAGQTAMKAIAHGVVGGVSSLASGGKFMNGFMSAGFTQTTSNIRGLYTEGRGINFGNSAKAAVVGGTASVLGGGKFANGAITGAFSRMFNEDLHTRRKQAEFKGSAVLDINGDPLTLSKRVNGEWGSPSGAMGIGDLIDELTKRSFFPLRDVLVRRVDIYEITYFEKITMPEVMLYDLDNVHNTSSLGYIYGEEKVSGIISEETLIRSYYEAKPETYFGISFGTHPLREIPLP